MGTHTVLQFGREMSCGESCAENAFPMITLLVYLLEEKRILFCANIALRISTSAFQKNFVNREKYFQI